MPVKPGVASMPYNEEYSILLYWILAVCNLFYRLLDNSFTYF